MRFPLIVLVVFSHVLSFDLEPINFSFSANNLYHFISEMISHVIGRIPVSCFFLFSGYFFFRYLKEWSLKIYKSRLLKRVRGILVPYLLWNVAMIVAIVVKNYLFSVVGIGNTEELAFLKSSSVYALLWEMPINFPLWFMRDLLCMSVIAPVIYLFFKYTKIYGLAALVIFYVFSGWETGVPGFSMRAIVFFGAGACFGIHKKNMLQIFSGINHFSVIAAIVLMFIATYFTATDYYEIFRRLFTIFGVAAIFNVMNKVVDSERNLSALLKLSKTVFFIYVAHSIYVMGWVKGAFYRTPLADSGIGMLIAYFLIPVTVILILIFIERLWRQFSPKSLSFFMGGRVNSKPKSL
ncbi:MAG: acyltransferase family protein [Bacteroidia bacterium]|nr:acyltransferase family protein [Bacteroidia bacterium]